MDAHQISPTSKGSKKRKKHKLPGFEEGKPKEISPELKSEVSVQSEKQKVQLSGSVTQQDIKSVQPSVKVSQKDNLHKQISLTKPTEKEEVKYSEVRFIEAPLRNSLESHSSEAEKSPTKRKRNRKKKKQAIQGDIQCEHKAEDHTPNTAVVSLSESFIPAVQEAIRLLQANEVQMNSSDLTGACASNSSKPSKKSKKQKSSEEINVSEVEKIISPGAQKLASDQAALNSLIEEGLKDSQSSLNTTVSGQGSIQPCTINSKDLEILLSARNIGPIYSRSTFTSSVAVTSSSLSSQLSSERIQSSHLYGNILQPATCKISSVIAAPPIQEMSAQAVQKSREEVEAERKARKAAKQAAKSKGKTIPLEEPVTKPDSSAAKVIEKSGGSQTVTTSKPQQESVEKRMEDVKKPSVAPSAKEVPKSKPVDVTDFARAFAPECLDHETIIRGIQIEKIKPSKAERRAKQEAQRAVKAQLQEKQKTQQLSNQPKKSSQPDTKPQQKDSKVKDLGKLKTAKELKDTKAERRVKLFSHLYQDSYKNISQSIGVNHPLYHLAIVRLGVQYANRVVLGSNARCLALLYALKELISDYETPPQKEFSRGLEAFLQPNMDFLHKCRPHSVSMINALRHIKWQLTQLSLDSSDTEARQQLQGAIDQYINDQIEKAAEAIGEAVSDKVADNDVILVYACSSLVLSALKKALDEKRKFRVVVVDSLPWLEGREMLRRLVSMGVQCSYVQLSAASFVMRHVSKVLLGAHALLANGYVMSRAGSSQVALLAHTYNVPVLVCCETHKFSERVQTDSFVYNEIGDPDELIGSRKAGEREAERERPLANWRDLPCLSLLNLVYDVTPPDLVTAVVTERAILPCTSVPVILRIKPPEC